jgi:hypothetical protein
MTLADVHPRPLAAVSVALPTRLSSAADRLSCSAYGPITQDIRSFVRRQHGIWGDTRLASQPPSIAARLRCLTGESKSLTSPSTCRCGTADATRDLAVMHGAKLGAADMRDNVVSLMVSRRESHHGNNCPACRKRRGRQGLDQIQQGEKPTPRPVGSPGPAHPSRRGCPCRGIRAAVPSQETASPNPIHGRPVPANPRFLIRRLPCFVISRL